MTDINEKPGFRPHEHLGEMRNGLHTAEKLIAKPAPKKEDEKK